MQVLIDGVLYVPAVESKPAEPDGAQHIRDVISQLRSQNVPWADIGMHLQSFAFGGIPLTPAQWEVAYAAGYPRPDAPGPSPDQGPDLTGPELTYAQVYGRPIPVTGSRHFTVTEAPANASVVAVQASGQTASTVTLNVNGAQETQPNLQGSLTVNANGPTLSIAVSSAEGSHLQVFVKEGA